MPHTAILFAHLDGDNSIDGRYRCEVEVHDVAGDHRQIVQAFILRLGVNVLLLSP